MLIHVRSNVVPSISMTFLVVCGEWGGHGTSRGKHVRVARKAGSRYGWSFVFCVLCVRARVREMGPISSGTVIMFWLVGVVMRMVGAGNGLGKRCAYLVGSEVWGWWFWPLLRADEVFGGHDMM